MGSNPRYIAWANGCSLAVGPTVESVISHASECVTAPRWQKHYPGDTRITVTTYGAQRPVSWHVIGPDGIAQEIKPA